MENFYSLEIVNVSVMFIENIKVEDNFVSEDVFINVKNTKNKKKEVILKMVEGNCFKKGEKKLYNL